MRLLGRWSLASFLKLLIDVPYYLLLVIFPAVFVITLWLALTPGQVGSVQTEIPVRLQLDPASHAIVTTGDEIQAVAITQTHGTLQIRGRVSRMGIAWAGWGYGIVSLGVVLFVLNRLRAIFRTLQGQNPFLAVNAARIRMIGVVLVLGELVNTWFGAWYAQRVTRGISVAGLTLSADWSLNGSVIFAGLILLTLAEVFRLGSEMQGDLETARKIQFDLMPGEMFRKNNTVIQARMRPAKTVGGDMYDVLKLDENRLAVMVGDVTGKGLPAAMLMASVLGSMRALCSAGLKGGELIAALNKHVCSSNAPGDRLVTLFYGELDTTTGEMIYVNAGHSPPILLRADGGVERLQPSAMVLGVKADTLVETRHIEIKPTDRLLLFTDGLPETFNKKDEEYGEKRLTESFARARTLPLPAAVERLILDVLSFSGSVPPSDDMTLMIVERQPT
jgi:serine phosphatase RsbU (regulator of sigma subunit)